MISKSLTIKVVSLMFAAAILHLPQLTSAQKHGDSLSIKSPNPLSKVVTSENFNKGFTTQVPMLVQGRLSGVNIYAKGSNGGEVQSLNRLINGADQKPVTLYVVDGIPMYYGGLYLNVASIESISYLEGGAAVVAYGLRASNGAFIITTKKGQQKLSVSYQGNTGVSVVAKKYDVYPADAFRQFIKDKHPDYSSKLGNASTDWQEAITRKGLISQHNIAVNGNAFTIPFSSSVGYSNEDGVIKTENEKLYNGILSISPSFFRNTLRFRGAFSFSRIDKRLVNPATFENAVLSDPTIPVYDKDNVFGYYMPEDNNGFLTSFNPLFMVDNIKEKENQTYLNKHIGLEYDIPYTGLGIAAGYFTSQFDNKYKYDEDGDVPWSYIWGLARRRTNNLEIKSWYSELSFKRAISSISSIFFVSVRYESLKNYIKEEEYLSRRQELFSISIQNINSKEQNIRTNLSFGYKDDVAVGTSLITYVNDELTKKSNVGFNVWGKWDAGRFFKRFSLLNSLTLMASYTNNHLNDSGKELGIFPKGFDMNYCDLNSFKLGFKSSWWNGRASFSLFYNGQTSKDIALLINLISNTSFYNYLTVYKGKLRSSNIEFEAQADLIRSSNISWRMGVNGSIVRNRVSSLPYEPFLTSDNFLVRNGRPIRSYQLKKQEYDANGDPIYNPNQEFYMSKSSTPSFIMGINMELSYKQWMLALNGRAVLDGYVYNNLKKRFPKGGATFLNGVNYSTGGEPKSWNNLSDHFLEKASYFKMDNITLSYHFNWVLPVSLSATVQNAFTITGYSGYDPEQIGGYDNIYMPRIRMYSIGLKVNLMK